MKTLGKQILQAFFMGIVVPGLVLSTVVRFDAPPEETTAAVTAYTEATENTILQLMRSTVPVLLEDGTVTEMELENYISGVVLAEMPVDFEPEALKAQAVVSRTYAMRRYESGTKHRQGAVCTDAACCQGYISKEAFLAKGGSEAGIRKVENAVLDTAGEVLTYQGELIEATYFSCSGGSTEDAAAVWGSDLPYLRATDSPGEENAAHYTDTVSFSTEEIASLLGVTFDGSPDTWFSVLSYTNGGGVGEIEVCGYPFTGVQLRTLLGLRSTAFRVSATEETVSFVTYGYGHRVGMSQYGADAMAVSGSSYDEILAHYYQSTVLEEYQPS